MAEGRIAPGTAIESNAGAVAEENKIKHLYSPSSHIWTPRLLQDKFSQLMLTTEIMIAAIYPVS
jgi:hypothetical protein